MGSLNSRFEIIHEVLSQADNRSRGTTLCEIAGAHGLAITTGFVQPTSESNEKHETGLISS